MQSVKTSKVCQLAVVRPSSTLDGGLIGIGVIQVLNLHGAKQILVMGLMDNRKELARRDGATDVPDSVVGDIPEGVHKVTNNKGNEALDQG